MIYSADGVAGGVHLIKVNNEDIDLNSEDMMKETELKIGLVRIFLKVNGLLLLHRNPSWLLDS